MEFKQNLSSSRQNLFSDSERIITGKDIFELLEKKKESPAASQKDANFLFGSTLETHNDTNQNSPLPL